ncbi:DUF5906 domain-containing protein [Treponema putidum]|uniref:DUF5906 domain-containing protein n=1 Tax=Treponema putidum TaxID=221027 RepID=UPI003D9407F0
MNNEISNYTFFDEAAMVDIVEQLGEFKLAGKTCFYIPNRLFVPSSKKIIDLMAKDLNGRELLTLKNLEKSFQNFLGEYSDNLWADRLRKSYPQGVLKETFSGDSTNTLYIKHSLAIETYMQIVINQYKVKTINHKADLNKFLEAIFHLGVNWQPETLAESCTSLRILFESILNVVGIPGAEKQSSCIILDQKPQGGGGKGVLIKGICKLLEKYGLNSTTITHPTGINGFLGIEAATNHLLVVEDLSIDRWKNIDKGIFNSIISKEDYECHNKFEKPFMSQSIATYIIATNKDLFIDSMDRRFSFIRYTPRCLRSDSIDPTSNSRLLKKEDQIYFDCYPYEGNNDFEKNLLYWLEQAFLSCPFGAYFQTDLSVKEKTSYMPGRYAIIQDWANEYYRTYFTYRDTLEPIPTDPLINSIDIDPIKIPPVPQNPCDFDANLLPYGMEYIIKPTVREFRKSLQEINITCIHKDTKQNEDTRDFFQNFFRDLKIRGIDWQDDESRHGKAWDTKKIDILAICNMDFGDIDLLFDTIPEFNGKTDQEKFFISFEHVYKTAITQELKLIEEQRLQQDNDTSCELPLEKEYSFDSYLFQYDTRVGNQAQEFIKQPDLKDTPIEPERVDIPIVEDIKPIEPIIEVKSTIEDKPMEAINTPLIVDDTEAQQEPKTPLLPEREELNSFLKKYRLSVTTDFYNKKVYTQIDDNYNNYQFLITGYPKEGNTRKGNIIPTAFCYEMDCMKDASKEEMEAFTQKQITFIKERIAKNPDVEKHIASLTFSGNKSVHILVPHNMGEEIKDDYEYYWDYIGRKLFKEAFDLFDKAFISPGHMSRTPNMIRIEDFGFEELEIGKQTALIVNGEIIDLTEVYKERQKELSDTSKSNSMILRKITAPFKKLIKTKGTFKNPTNGNRGLKDLEEMAKINPNLKEALEIYKNKDTSQGFNPVGIIQSLRQNSFSKTFVEKEIFPYMSKHSTNATKDFNYYWHYNG